MKKDASVNYSVKELIQSLHLKIDEMDKKLDEGNKKFSAIETSLAWHFVAISLLYTALGACLFTPVRTFIEHIFGG